MNSMYRLVWLIGLVCLLSLSAFSSAAQETSRINEAPYPEGYILDSTPEFVVPHAEGNEWYQLQVMVEGFLVHNEWHEAVGCDPFAFCTLYPEANLAPELGHNDGIWQHRAWSEADGISEWSSGIEFTLLAPNTTDVTQTNTPSPNYIIQYLQDGNGERPDLYRMVIIGAGGVRLDMWTPPVSCSAEAMTCALYPYPDPFLANGDYTIYVQAFTNGVGLSAWSGARNYSVNTAAPQMPEDIFINAVYQNGNPENPCNAFEGVQGNLCTTQTLSFSIGYDEGQTEWMELRIEELPGDVIYSTWIKVDGNAFCIFEGYCTIQVPIVFEYGQTYAWRARIWNEYGGLSQYTVPGGGASGDPNNAGIFTVAEPVITVRPGE